jgi:hypothetical protein
VKNHGLSKKHALASVVFALEQFASFACASLGAWAALSTQTPKFFLFAVVLFPLLERRRWFDLLFACVRSLSAGFLFGLLVFWNPWIRLPLSSGLGVAALCGFFTGLLLTRLGRSEPLARFRDFSTDGAWRERVNRDDESAPHLQRYDLWLVACDQTESDVRDVLTKELNIPAGMAQRFMASCPSLLMAGATDENISHWQKKIAATTAIIRVMPANSPRPHLEDDLVETARRC